MKIWDLEEHFVVIQYWHRGCRWRTEEERLERTPELQRVSLSIGHRKLVGLLARADVVCSSQTAGVLRDLSGDLWNVSFALSETAKVLRAKGLVH